MRIYRVRLRPFAKQIKLTVFHSFVFQHDSDILKRGGDHTIQYFKIRNCNIPRLADHIFMGMKIEHLYIHNCSKYDFTNILNVCSPIL